MSVALATLGWGTVQDVAGNAVVGSAYSIRDGSSVVVASGVTDSLGRISGSLTAGDYTLTLNGTTYAVSVPLSVAVATGAASTVVTYGADPTGVADSTSAFNSALAAGSATIPDGTYLISGVVNVPYTSDLRGSGSGKCILNLGAAGQIRHGVLNTGQVLPGCRTSGFRVDGGNVQNVTGGAFWVGLAIGRTFADLTVRNGKKQGVRLEQAQNCRFDNVTMQTFDLACLSLDNGTGGHKFDKCEIGISKDYAIRIDQTVAVVPGLYSAPSYNTWDGCIIEYVGTGGLGMVYTSGGAQNVFTNTSINPTGATAAADAVKMVRGGTPVTEIILNNCDSYGVVAYTRGVNMTGSTVLTLQGRNRFFTHLEAVRTAWGTDQIDRLGRTDFYSCASKFVDTSGSAVPWLEDTRTLTLAANVSAFGAGVSPGEIYLEQGGSGVVRCRGALKTSVDKAIGDPIFTLPSGMGQLPNYGGVYFCAVGVGGVPFVGGSPATLAIDQGGVARLSAALPAAGGYGVFFDFTYQSARF